ncbi:MAG TPA: hypothetical protein VGL10_02875 [Gammaproteobacteria bacterium]
MDKSARINELAEKLEELARSMNRARPGSYTSDVLRFYAYEIDAIARSLREVTLEK